MGAWEIAVAKQIDRDKLRIAFRTLGDECMGAVEEPKVGHLRGGLDPVGNGPAHVVRAIDTSPRNRGIESVPQSGALRLVDRVLGRREMPSAISVLSQASWSGVKVIFMSGL
jgi:hypothetical protein